MKKVGYIINIVLGWMGFRLHRVKSITNLSLEFDPVFSRLVARKISVSSVIDIGASNGCWSQKLDRYYPHSRYHLVEANNHHKPELEEYVRQHPNSSFTIAAAAETVGEIYFDDTDPWGGVAAWESDNATAKKVRCTTVDDEVAKNQLQGPFLLKLDTHGFEVPILKGAVKTLDQTNVIVLEAYNFHLSDHSLTFWEICEYLYRQGFRPTDFLEPLHRPKDGVIWQLDIIFLGSERPEFQDNHFG